MNPEQFTEKTSKALDSAYTLARNSGHARTTPIHIALALISDPNGIFPEAVSNAGGGNEAAESLERLLEQALEKIPHEIPSIPYWGAKHCSFFGNPTPAVDQLILCLLEYSQISDIIKEVGVSAAQVKSEVEKLREEWWKVMSAFRDTNLKALKTYGRDLIQEAGKLHTVIYRNNEICKVAWILSRTRNNPVIIGKPGVARCGEDCLGRRARAENREGQNQRAKIFYGREVGGAGYGRLVRSWESLHTTTMQCSCFEFLEFLQR